MKWSLRIGVAILVSGVLASLWMSAQESRQEPTAAQTDDKPRLILCGELIDPPYKITSRDGSLWVNDLCADPLEEVAQPKITVPQPVKDASAVIDSLFEDFRGALASGSDLETALAERDATLADSPTVDSFEAGENGVVTIYFKGVKAPTLLTFNPDFGKDMPSEREIEDSRAEALKLSVTNIQDILDRGGYVILHRTGSMQAYEAKAGRALFGSIASVMRSDKTQEYKERKIQKLVLDPAVAKSIIANFQVEEE